MGVNLAGLVNQLRATLGKMEVALGAIADAIVWTGKDTKVQWCNAAFDKLVNRPHILVLGVKLSDLLPLMHAGQPVALDSYPDVRLLSGDYEAATEYEFQQGDRSLILEISGNCVELTSSDKSAVLVIRDVTQAKRMEAERKRIKEALQQQAAAIQASVDGIAILDPNQTYVYLNESYAKIYGHDNAQELVGKNWKALYDEAELQRFEQELTPKFSIRGQWCGEAIGTRRDGSKFPQELSLTKIQNGGAICIVRDISIRKKAEAALRRSEVKFRNIFENSQVGIMRTTRVEDGLILEANQRLIELTGYSCAADVIGKRFTTEFYVNLEQRQRMLTELHQNGKVENFEMQFCQRNGTLRWGLFSLHLNSEETCLDMVVTDISDRKQVEADLRRSNAILKAQQEASIDGILVVDENNKVASYNQRFCQLWQIIETIIQSGSAQQVREYMFHKLEQPEEFLAKLEYLYEHPEEVSRDEICLKDGRTLDCYSAAVRSPTGDYYGRIWYFRDITDHKQAEQALRSAEAATRASELRFRSIVSNTSGVIYRCAYDADWTMEFISNEIETISSYPATDFIGNQVRTFASIIHPEDTAMVEQVVQQGIEARQPYAIEYRVVRADGGIRWVYEKGQGIYDEDGLLWLDGAIFDVSDRKQAEAALRLIFEGTASKTGDEFFRSFIRYLAEVLRVRYGLVTECVNEAKTRVRTLASWGGEANSENFEYNLWGTPCEGVFRGKMCFYPENLQALFPDDPDVVTMGAESYLGIPLTNSSGIILGHLAVIDVKPMAHDPGRELILKIFAARAGAELERKQANEALQRRAQLDSLLSNISRQFIDQDVDTAINFTLEAIAQFTGAERSCIFEFSDDQSYGYLIHEWYAVGIEPLSDGARGSPVEMFPRFNQILSGKVFQVPCVAELPLDAAERKLFESQSIQSVVVVPMLHSGKVVGFIGSDLVHFSKTWSQEDINLLKLVGELIAIGRARHKAEEALRDAKEAAEAANRAKSVFLANMSHELRTPLNAILGFAQLMERDVALTSRQRDSLTIINRSGEHLLNLINDVLEMSKIEAGRITLSPAPFDLHRLLQTIQEMFQVRAEAKRLYLQVELAPNLPQYILSDEGKLRQVLINLLGNAIKFTDSGGVTLRVRVQSSTLHFEIADTGKGISAEDLGKLFQPFVQVVREAQAREGTGLGLTISRQFVQLMGGDIHLTSVVARGSTFYFDIKVELAEPSEVAPPQARGRVLRLAPSQPVYRILVVDDQKENCDLLTQLLNIVGFETRAAANGQEAIAHWQAWHPHLIWMDMRMPVMDGYEATRLIKAQPQGRATAIVALTASAFEEQQADILAAGCDDLIRKPFREQVIFNKLAEHLGVQYVYAEEEESRGAQVQGCSRDFHLESSDLTAMPVEWVAALHQASVQVDSDLIFQLLQQIPESNQALVEGLANLANHFCFDEIIALTQGDSDASTKPI